MLKSEEGDLKAVAKILQNDKDQMQQRNKNGYTALTLAVKNKNMDVVHYLLKNNASTEIGNKVFYIIFVILIS